MIGKNAKKIAMIEWYYLLQRIVLFKRFSLSCIFLFQI